MATDDNKDEPNGPETQKTAIVIDLQTHRRIKEFFKGMFDRTALVRNVEATHPGLWHSTEKEVMREQFRAKAEETRQRTRRLSCRFNYASAGIYMLLGLTLGGGLTQAYPAQASKILNVSMTLAALLVAGQSVFIVRKALTEIKANKVHPIDDTFELTRQRLMAQLRPPEA